MFKRICIVVLSVLLLMSMLPIPMHAESTASVPMYAADGRIISVKTSDVSLWENVGWYTYPVSYMYSADARRIIVPTKDIALWEAVYWYTEPVVLMYAIDGRRLYVKESSEQAFRDVGWYMPYELVLGKHKSDVEKIFGKMTFLDWFHYGEGIFYNDLIDAIFVYDVETIFDKYKDVEYAMNNKNIQDRGCTVVWIYGVRDIFPSVIKYADANGNISRENFRQACNVDTYLRNDEFNFRMEGYYTQLYKDGYMMWISCDSSGTINISTEVLVQYPY